MGTKFDVKVSDGVKGHVGVGQRSTGFGMPYGHQLWSEEPLTKAYCFVGIKGHARVIRGNQRLIY